MGTEGWSGREVKSSPANVSTNSSPAHISVLTIRLYLGVVRSTFHDRELNWLLWIDEVAKMLPHGGKLADTEAERADAEAERANAESKRAEAAEAELAELPATLAELEGGK